MPQAFSTKNPNCYHTGHSRTNESEQQVCVRLTQLNIQNAGEVAVKDIKITMSNFNAHNYLRVAFGSRNCKGTVH